MSETDPGDSYDAIVLGAGPAFPTVSEGWLRLLQAYRDGD